MAPAGLHEFLALTEGRTDTEIAHVLAVLTATTQHIDQHKETEMGRKHALPERDQEQLNQTVLHRPSGHVGRIVEADVANGTYTVQAGARTIYAEGPELHLVEEGR